MVLCLQRVNAIKKLLDLVGPENPIEARKIDEFYWRSIYGQDIIRNGLYCNATI